MASQLRTVSGNFRKIDMISCYGRRLSWQAKIGRAAIFISQGLLQTFAWVVASPQDTGNLKMANNLLGTLLDTTATYIELIEYWKLVDLMFIHCCFFWGSAGIALHNPIPADYVEHIKKFLPVMRSFNEHSAAKHLEDWVTGELALKPIWTLASFPGLLRQNLVFPEIFNFIFIIYMV